ncbi:MAG: hypothetical protein ATN36_07270 [Epulopiscium sp. Nele67-Bin005]|nr:MAG: hypothetical protein ATN36_07270 [Epulopiscium sp. Nele67-Bin005]
MKEILDEIIEVDKNVYEYKVNKGKELEELKKTLEADIEYKCKNIMESKREEAELLGLVVVEEGDMNRKLIEEHSHQNVLEIKNSYLKIKEELQIQVFQDIFSMQEGL